MGLRRILGAIHCSASCYRAGDTCSTASAQQMLHPNDAGEANVAVGSLQLYLIALQRRAHEAVQLANWISPGARLQLWSSW